MDGAGAITLKGDGSRFVASAEGEALAYLKSLPATATATDTEWAAWTGSGTSFRIGQATAKKLGA